MVTAARYWCRCNLSQVVHQRNTAGTRTLTETQRNRVYIDQRNIHVCLNECNCRNTVSDTARQIRHIFPLLCFYLIGSFDPSWHNKPTTRFIRQFVCVGLTCDPSTIFPTFVHQFYFTTCWFVQLPTTKTEKRSMMLVTLRATWWDFDQQITHPAMFSAFLLTTSQWPHMFRSIRQIGMDWKQRVCCPRTPWNYL